MQIPGERTLLLTDERYRHLAGNLAVWPKEINGAPGTRAVMVDLAGQATHTMLVQTTLAGGYHLLVGRDLSRFLPPMSSTLSRTINGMRDHIEHLISGISNVSNSIAHDLRPGITEADKPRATERFFRCDTSRGTPGVGLGLAIVDAVAKLHGGVPQLLDSHPGLRAQMVLPVGAARTSR